MNRFQSILQNPLLINTAKLSGSNIIMYMLPLIVTPILSRLYSMDAFAQWGVFSSVVSIVTTGLFLGLENTIIKVKNNEIYDVVSLCVTVSGLVVCAIALVFAVGQFFHISSIQSFPSTILLIAYLCMYVIYSIFYNLCNRKELYGTLAMSSLVQGGAQAIFRILLGILALTLVNGLILGVILAQVVVIAFMFVPLSKYKVNINDLIKRLRYTSLLETISKHRNFPLYDAPSGVLSFAAFNVPLLVLNKYFDVSVVGCYTIVLQLLLLPMSFVGSAIGKVYYQRICQYGVNNDEFIGRTTQEIVKLLLVLSVIPIIFITCGGDKLIVLYLGDKWHMAGTISLCLSLWSFSILLTQPLLPLFRALNKQRTLLWYDIAYAIVGIGSVVLGCVLTNDLKLILMCYAALSAVIKLLLLRKIHQLSKLPINIDCRIAVLWFIAASLFLMRMYI